LAFYPSKEYRMNEFNRQAGLSTLVNHAGEGHQPNHSHVAPIFQTSTFSFPDVATGAALFKGEAEGYIYTRMANPNQAQLAEKLAVLEGIDLLRQAPDKPLKQVVDGLVFTSGMAAVSSAVLACVKAGDTIIAQKSLYGASFNLLNDLAPRYGIKVFFLDDISLPSWEAALKAHPEAKLLYCETPANPTMALVDLKAVSDLAHKQGAWVMVDNTFATPYCQRPLSLGCDVVVHSTTKYLSGHGTVIGGTVISRHTDYVRKDLYTMLKLLGGSPSPFDCWLSNIGLKTLEIRMERHCANAMQVAKHLESHPAVATVYYPGLESHRDHELAKRQMHGFGGMIAFDLKGGLQAGEKMMNRVKLATLAVSLGNVDTLIQHPASMTHASMGKEARLAASITDGLVRLSVGIENVEDIIADLDQAMVE
jgi:methionine-gamma-lyase